MQIKLLHMCTTQVIAVAKKVSQKLFSLKPISDQELITYVTAFLNILIYMKFQHANFTLRF